MQIRRLLLASFVAAPAILLSSPAAAQPPSDPTTIQGNIQVCEAARGEHRVQLEAGRRYAITANSEAFDTLLRLLRPGSEEPIAENDDYGEGLNSRINYTPTESGEYVVRVSSFSPGGTGAYQLRVEPAGPLPALITRPTRTERGQWRVYQGTLAATDPVDNERRYDDYELRLTAGQAAMIHVIADGELDTQLMVYSNEGRGGEPLASNDDGGGGVNPFILFAPEEAGTYVVRVTSFGANETGGYRLRISQ